MTALAPRPGIYGPTSGAPGTFVIESGRGPQINPASANVRATDDRATWGVSHPWRWDDSAPYHKYQPQRAAIFSLGPYHPGSARDVVKLLSVDQINRISRQSWRHHEETGRQNSSVTPGTIEETLRRMTTDYNHGVEKTVDLKDGAVKVMVKGEDLYYFNAEWKNCSTFYTHHKYTRFLWMSHVSISHTARYAGPKILHTDGDSFMPNLACTTVTNGYAAITNYWGALQTGERLYFIIRKYPNGGCYYLDAWHGFAAPLSADLEYVDKDDRIRSGAYYFVGIVNRRPESLPTEDERRTALGLKDETLERTYKITSNCPWVDILSHVGDPRG